MSRLKGKLRKMGNKYSGLPAAVAAFEFSRGFMVFEKIMRPGAVDGVARVVYSRRFGRGMRE